MKAPVQEKAQRVLAPQGTHVARIVRLIDIGTIPTEWQGEARMTHKIWLDFELVDETYKFKDGEDEKPFVLGRKYTFSMSEKASLRKIIEGIIGASLLEQEAVAFDVEQIVGKACLVNIKHNQVGDKTYANIETAAPLMKGQKAKEAFNPIVTLTYENWDEDTFTSLPDFIKEMIESSKEYKRMKSPVPLNKNATPLEYPKDEINPEDIPF